MGCLSRSDGGPQIRGDDWVKPVVRAVKGFTKDRTKEIEVYWIHRKGAAGRTAEERLCAGRQWVEAVL